jgi:hypothetical protein
MTTFSVHVHTNGRSYGKPRLCVVAWPMLLGRDVESWQVYVRYALPHTTEQDEIFKLCGSFETSGFDCENVFLQGVALCVSKFMMSNYEPFLTSVVVYSMNLCDILANIVALLKQMKENTTIDVSNSPFQASVCVKSNYSMHGWKHSVNLEDKYSHVVAFNPPAADGARFAPTQPTHGLPVPIPPVFSSPKSIVSRAMLPRPVGSIRTGGKPAASIKAANSNFKLVGPANASQKSKADLKKHESLRARLQRVETLVNMVTLPSVYNSGTTGIGHGGVSLFTPASTPVMSPFTHPPTMAVPSNDSVCPRLPSMNTATSRNGFVMGNNQSFAQQSFGNATDERREEEWSVPYSPEFDSGGADGVFTGSDGDGDMTDNEGVSHFDPLSLAQPVSTDLQPPGVTYMHSCSTFHCQEVNTYFRT